MGGAGQRKSSEGEFSEDLKQEVSEGNGALRLLRLVGMNDGKITCCLINYLIVKTAPWRATEHISPTTSSLCTDIGESTAAHVPVE